MYRFKKNFYADIRIEDRFNTTITYLNEALRECKETVVKKAFIRVFDGNMWYYSSTSDIDNIQSELDALYENATENIDINNHPAIKILEVNKEEKLIFEKSNLRKTPLSKKQNFIIENKKLFDSIDYLKMLNSIYSDRHSIYEFYSSKGACIKYDTQYCGYYFAMSFANGDKLFDGTIKGAATDFNELKIDSKSAKDTITEYQSFLLNSVDADKGDYPIILSPEAAGIFAHESFGHKSEADFMLGNDNMQKEWAIGKKVSAAILSIYDTGEQLGTGYVPFDDEGTKTKTAYLIKDGVLTGRLHSAATASAINETLTGNSRAINTGFEPIVRMRNTVIAAGKDKVEDLISRVKKGYFIKTVKHGSGMSTFTIAPNLAYEIVDGKICRPVKIAVITGNVFETLGLIDGLSDKIETSQSIMGGCGKMEQYPLNVDFGGPYVSVSKMNIS